MKNISAIGFNYDGLNNAGDYIQSIATERLIHPVKERYERDYLSSAKPSSLSYVIMNGWFSHSPESCLPISPNIIPVFWGFHISPSKNGWEYFTRQETIEYLKRHEPIGCRDIYTAQKLKEYGVNTFVSYCLSLTLPLRTYPPKNKFIYIVDGKYLPLPAKITKEAIYYSHRISEYYSESFKFNFAHHLLYQYATNAKLIITTRLHCLLPCIAMGIPVIYFGDKNDYRVSWVEKLNIPVYTRDDIANIDWNPLPLEFELFKEQLIDKFQSFFQERISHYT